MQVLAESSLSEMQMRLDPPMPLEASASDEAERHQRISDLAHQLYLARGENDGDALTDWLEAERQVDAGTDLIEH